MLEGENMRSKGSFQTTRFALIALAFCCVAAFSTINMARSSTAVRAASCPSTCGSYNVPGLGARKQQILNTGGNSLDLAIAMMETETMQTNYTYGDGKSGDSANFGIFKQNWYMLRTSVPQYESYGSGSYNAGAALNSNLSWDIQCLHDGQNHYGLYKWFGGQRDGQTGLNNPGTADINSYRNGVYWLQSQITNGHMYDNVRFWLTGVPAI
jgi:hypothetical protein